MAPVARAAAAVKAAQPVKAAELPVKVAKPVVQPVKVAKPVERPVKAAKLAARAVQAEKAALLWSSIPVATTTMKPRAVPVTSMTIRIHL